MYNISYAHALFFLPRYYDFKESLYPRYIAPTEMSRVYKFHELEFRKEHDALQAITNYVITDT
jgi:hypothetical protein